MNFIDRMLKNRAEKSLHPRHIMNISLFLSVIMVFSTFANNNVYSQVEISLDVEHQPIISILDNIESQTELRFIFGSEIYDFEKEVSLSVTNAKIDEIIKLLFENELSYTLTENVVLLSKAIQTSNTPLTDDKEELEEIVDNLESGNIDLDKSIQYYTRGSQIRAHCQKKLDEAVMKLDEIQVSSEGKISKKTK